MPLSFRRITEIARRPDAGRTGAYGPRGALLAAYGLALVLAVLAAPLALAQEQSPGGDEIALTVGRSVVLDHPDELHRVAITDDSVADAIAISTREVLINAKTPGVTTLILWSKSGDRNFFTIKVDQNVQQVQEHIRATFPGEDIRVTASKGVVALTGRVSDPQIADRAVAMAAGSTGVAVVNSIELPTPPQERQILLKVKFAEVQRSATQSFGVNIISTGALNTPGAISTQQFGNNQASNLTSSIGASVTGTTSVFTLSDALNVFAFRPDLNLGVTIQALKQQGLIEILAEPNIVTTSGKEAKFLVGGEFPVPVIQGGGAAGSVTVQFREFGIRLTFLPELTASGSIKMHVNPEVSALDFANGVTLSGFLIPALSTRRVDTDVELMPGQSFVIAGLIDNRVAETVSRVPGLSSIPLLGEIFKSRKKDKNNTELLVLVTPEFPPVLQPGAKLPELKMPVEFMEPLSSLEKPE
jgi:pilus assembly protein CpaC